MPLKVEGPASAIKGAVNLPGDKSISHRALLLAAMTRGKSRLDGFLYAGVTRAMMDPLSKLGVEFEIPDNDSLLVTGHPWRPVEGALDCRNSGTTMRLLAGALAGHKFESQLTGSAGLQLRPMGRIIEPLRLMGAQISGENGSNRPPLTITGGDLQGIDYRLPIASAQVKTALLVAGLTAQGATILKEPGPSRDHTERMLNYLGIEIQSERGHVRLAPPATPLAPFELHIPGDISSAAFLMTAAILIPGSQLELKQVGVNPTRTGMLEVLEEMGADIAMLARGQESAEPTATLQIRPGRLRAANIEGDRVVRMIDEFPIFAVAATQASGVTRVSGAQELRHKESDRIDALVTELRKMGASIEAQPDGFIIEGPTTLHGARVECHGDHRLAMALTIAGMVAKGATMIEGAKMIDESFPGFSELLVSLGASLS